MWQAPINKVYGIKEQINSRISDENFKKEPEINARDKTKQTNK
jgi:hypothetical protein